MAEQTPETLNHFALIAFTSAYWQLDPATRGRWRGEWLGRLHKTAGTIHLYQVSGFEARSDLMIWSAIPGATPDVTARFFSGWAAALAGARHLIEIRDVLWGFTRPSQYTRTRSTQELDPFAPQRQPFLIVYPFVKTNEWYQLDQGVRQRMMGGHIRVGKQYEEITQLLLYSFGLQDQEFVVVYETPDPRRFLALVNELRGVEGRPYTARDWPLHSGLYQVDDEALAAWL